MIRNIASGVRLSQMTGAMRRAVSSFFIDLRSSLLTLGKVQASLTLLSLNRSLHHSSFFILHSSLIIALTAIAACSSDSGEEQRPVEPTPEPVVSTEVAITFSGHEDEEKAVDTGSTRAETRAGTPLSEMDVTQFKVWGYKNMDYTEPGLQEVFPGYIVKWLENSAATTTTNSSGWEYILAEPADQTIKYWDWAAWAYRFFAVTNWAGAPPTPPTDYVVNEAYGANGANEYRISMLANCSDDDGDGTPEEDEVIADNMAATPFFSHLWFSTDALPTYADKRFGKPVQLEFLKPYARVRFIFNYSYEQEGIRLTEKCFKPTADYGDGEKQKIALKGKFTVIYPLTGTATSESFSVTEVDAASRLEAFTQDYVTDGNEKWYFVLPNNTQGSYTMSVSVNGETKTAVVPAEYMHWLPGYSYTYIFKILDLGGVEIEMVQSAVTPWTEMVANRTVHNW